MFTQAKMIIYAVVATIILGGWLTIRHLNKENKVLIGEGAVKTEQIANQADTIVKTQDSTAITEDTIEKVIVNDQKTTVKHEGIVGKTQEKERQVIADFTTQPVPPNPLQKVNAISTVRIDGLWESYCAAAPKASGCEPPAPTPALAASAPSLPVITVKP